MTNLQDILETQRQLEESIGSRMATFERKLQSSASSENKGNLDKLSQEFNDFRVFTMDVLKLLRTQIQSLTSQVDEIDNHNRRNALLFNGVPEKENEDCTSVVINIIHSNMNLKTVQASNFYLCHRLGSRSENRVRPILVRFTDINVRNSVWSEKKKLKSSSAILCEFLTRPRHDLFMTARKHFGITSCWTSNGVVYVKTPDNNRNRITSAQELEKCMDKFPGASERKNTASGRSAAESRPKASPKPAASVTSVEPPQTRRNIAAKSKVHK